MPVTMDAAIGGFATLWLGSSLETLTRIPRSTLVLLHNDAI